MYLKKPNKSSHLTVKLPGVNQDIVIGNGLLVWLAREIAAHQYSKTILLIDKNVARMHRMKLLRLINKIHPETIIYVEPKESSKSLRFLNHVLEECCQHEMNRRSCLVAVGGGVVGDITGFIASVYMRGIDYIFVPTTLMAQGDTIISKVAISYKLLKNVVGSCFSPVLTICDISFLDSLPKKEISFGLSEIIKHSLINGGVLLRLLSKTLHDDLRFWKKYPWKEIIYQSIIIKSRAVKQDPFDKRGSHKSLSYGHTFANALEGISTFQYRHGEAVALGMQLSGLISNRLGILSQKDLQKQNMLIKHALLPQHIMSNIDKKEIITFLRKDKISSNGEITLVLLRRPGRHLISRSITENVVQEAINEIQVA